MGISNYLPNSRISQSGVCTSITRPSSPYEGQIIYETDTNTVRVYDGTFWQYMFPSPSASRNLIINGDFRINQRAFSSTTTNAVYGFDRWQLLTSGGTCTYSSQAFTLGAGVDANYEAQNYARLVTSGQSAAGNFSFLNQRIEDVRNCAGATVAVSFWARAGSGTPKVAVELAQIFGTGGSPSAQVNTYAGQATLSTAWQRFSFLVSVPSIIGKTIGTDANSSGLRLTLWVSAGSDFNVRTNSLGLQAATFDFWGVQVEVGSYVSLFEQRPIGQELALCERYFQRLLRPLLRGAWSSTTAYGRCGTTIPRMRSAPIITMNGTHTVWDSTNVGTVTALSAYYSSPQYFEIDGTRATGTFVANRPCIFYDDGGTQSIDCNAEW